MSLPPCRAAPPHERMLPSCSETSDGRGRPRDGDARLRARLPAVRESRRCPPGLLEIVSGPRTHGWLIMVRGVVRSVATVVVLVLVPSACGSDHKQGAATP